MFQNLSHDCLQQKLELVGCSSFFLSFGWHLWFRYLQVITKPFFQNVIIKELYIIIIKMNKELVCFSKDSHSVLEFLQFKIITNFRTGIL